MFKPHVQCRIQPEEMSSNKTLTGKKKTHTKTKQQKKTNHQTCFLFSWDWTELNKWNKNHVYDFMLEKLPVKLLNHDIADTPLILLLQLREGNRIPWRKLQGSFFNTYASSKSLVHMNVVNTVFRVYPNTYPLLLEVSRQRPSLASRNFHPDAVAGELGRTLVCQAQHCTEFLLCSADQKLLRSYSRRETIRPVWENWKRKGFPLSLGRGLRFCLSMSRTIPLTAEHTHL